MIDFSLYLKETQDSDGKQYVWWISDSKFFGFCVLLFFKDKPICQSVGAHQC